MSRQSGNQPFITMSPSNEPGEQVRKSKNHSFARLRRPHEARVAVCEGMLLLPRLCTRASARQPAAIQPSSPWCWYRAVVSKVTLQLFVCVVFSWLISSRSNFRRFTCRPPLWLVQAGLPHLVLLLLHKPKSEQALEWPFRRSYSSTAHSNACEMPATRERASCARIRSS
jgi:hypothetical protein